MSSGVEVRLSKVFYSDGQEVSVTVDFGEHDPGTGEIGVVLSAPKSGDLEPLTLTKDTGSVYGVDQPIPVKAAGTSVEQGDGSLTIEPGEAFYSLYFPDPSEPPFDQLETNVVADVGFLRNPAIKAGVVEPEAALTEDETDPAPGDKPVGTLIPRDGLPVQLATEELIYYPKSDAEQERFLAETGGEIIATEPLEPAENGESYPEMHLVRVQPPAEAATELAVLRQYLGETNEMMVSREAVLAITGYARRLRLDGYLVAVNPRLQYQGAPSINDPATLTHTMKLEAANSVSGSCMPGDPSRTCVENVPAVWAYTALWDADDQRIDTAVLDMGFAPNDDFRRPESGQLIQCDMTGSNDCEPGAAEGAPTVGNSFFGDRSWHGTGVVSTIGAVVNNGFGVAGVGGQVAVPQLYKYDTVAYAFEMGKGIRLATDNGASCINISGGYPCKILTTVGPDFELCSEGGRAKACAVITAGVAGAASLACAATSWIPFVGSVVCGAGGIIVTAEVSACLSTLAFGNFRGPIQNGVRYARYQGVPVVTIAGNVITRDALPPILRDYVALGNHRTEDWGIMPAMAPDAIVVAAANSNLDNVHYFGDRVDIWAPISSAYMAPQDVSNPSSSLTRQTIGGTSAAAPFITGLVSTVQAVNPELNPKNPDIMLDATRRTIVGRIKDLLTDEDNSFSNSELVALGFSDQPERRRRLVDPLAVIQAAGRERVPDLSGLGYDQTLGFSERDGADDTSATARNLSFGDWMSGTLLTLPTEGGTAPPPDEDWYEFTLPSSVGSIGQATVTLRYPQGHGALYLLGDNLALSLRGSTGPEEEIQYTVVAPTGTPVHFRVASSHLEDNVYRVKVDGAELAEPRVRIVEPPASGGSVNVCAGESQTLRAEVDFPRFSDVTVPAGSIAWSDGTSTLGSGDTITASFSAGTHEVEVRAFDRADLSDSITINATECTNEPPTVVITTPSEDATGSNLDFQYDGYDDDRGMWYKDVTLEGSGTDLEDGTLPGSSLVWKTDRTDIQEEILGTGSSVTVRLYSDVCEGTTHTIRLEAEDSDGNPATPAVRTITIWTIC